MSITLLERVRPGSRKRVRADHAAGTRTAIAQLRAFVHRRIAMILGAEVANPITELLRLGSFATGLAGQQVESPALDASQTIGPATCILRGSCSPAR